MLHWFRIQTRPGPVLVGLHQQVADTLTRNLTYSATLHLVSATATTWSLSAAAISCTNMQAITVVKRQPLTHTMTTYGPVSSEFA